MSVAAGVTELVGDDVSGEFALDRLRRAGVARLGELQALAPAPALQTDAGRFAARVPRRQRGTGVRGDRPWTSVE